MGRVIFYGGKIEMNAPVGDILVNNLEIGSIVKLMLNNIETEFIVVNKGIPENSSLYNSECDGLWLLQKDMNETKVYDTWGYNGYGWAGSNVNIAPWLNETYFTYFDELAQSVIKEVRIPYTPDSGSSRVYSGDSGYKAKVFFLSNYELGYTSSNNYYYPVDGAKLEYFISGTGSEANNLRISAFSTNGSVYKWWTRSQNYIGNNTVWGINASGASEGIGGADSAGVRPAIILPYDVIFDAKTKLLKGVNTKYNTIFADNSWEQIIEACQTNNIPSTWRIGDQKAMTINGTDYLIDIIGKNHDTYSDGSGKAPLTFQMRNCYTATYYMHNSQGTYVGWKDSWQRNTFLVDAFWFYQSLPSEVKNGIRKVKKLTATSKSDGTIVETEDKLFLLSEVEVFGSCIHSHTGEGLQYEYYKSGNSKIKLKGNVAQNWWLRSPSNFSRYYACYVTSDGGAENYDVDSNQGVSFAFCF